MQSIHEIIKRRELRMTVSSVKDNPHMEIKAGMSHWRCSFVNEAGARMRVIFSQGSAYQGKQPEIATVLDCLASDAATVEQARSFVDWCGELGYDVDSRKAERTWKTCQRQCDSLKSLMGADFLPLLYETERL